MKTAQDEKLEDSENSEISFKRLGRMVLHCPASKHGVNLTSVYLAAQSQIMCKCSVELVKSGLIKKRCVIIVELTEKTVGGDPMKRKKIVGVGHPLLGSPEGPYRTVNSNRQPVEKVVAP